MEDKNFAFYVSGSASRLKTLFTKGASLLHKTKVVVHDGLFSEGLKLECVTLDICYHHVDYDKLPNGHSKSTFLSSILLDKLDYYKVDYCFCFGDKILKGDILEKYRNRIINFHPSVLPSFPGNNAIDKALDSSSFLLGNTAHFIDSGVDTGPVIMQNVINSSTFKDYNSVLNNQITMLEQIYKWIMDNRIYVVNNEVVIDKADYNRVVYFPSIEI